MHLEFGGNDGCVGFLIGDAGRGLVQMFQMMNTARLGVGLAGSYIASAAYYASLQYAMERFQGNTTSPEKSMQQVLIINHPDVRRMLLLQKATTEGTLALVMQCYYYEDLLKVCSPHEKTRYTDLLELLTPVAKTCGAEMGFVSVSNGMQVLGGYGYTEDFTIEQLLRDVRIMSIYEGTTGIQSQALLGRQIPADDGRAFTFWVEEVSKVTQAAEASGELGFYGNWLSMDVRELERTTQHLLNVRHNKLDDIFLSDANLYMEVFGLVCVAWQWLKQSVVAARRIKEDVSPADRTFYVSKIETMRFFFRYELRKTKALHERLRDDTILTIRKDEEILI